MKKLLFIAFVAVIGLGSANAQKGVLNGGLNVGLPVGNADDISNFVLGAELNYMFPVAEGVTLGPSVQYSHFFGEEYEFLGNTIEASDVSFLPVSGAVRFNITQDFVAGANLGYAIGLNDGNEGGFYYRPMLGYKIADNTQLNISYAGISNDGSDFSNIAIGIMFGL
jgi:hypothetical protein